MDNNLKTYDPKEVQVALLCTQNAPEERPRMAEVVQMLKGAGLAQRWGEGERLEEAINRELQLSFMTHALHGCMNQPWRCKKPCNYLHQDDIVRAIL